MPILFDEFPTGAGLQSASDTVNTQLGVVGQMMRVRLAAEEAKRQVASENAFAEGVQWASSNQGVDQTRLAGVGINEWLPKDSEAKRAEADAIAARITDPRMALQFREMRELEAEEEEEARRTQDFANTLEANVRAGLLDPQVRDSLLQAAELDPKQARFAYVKQATAEAKLGGELEARSADLQRADAVAQALRPSAQKQYQLPRGLYERGAITSDQFARSMEGLQRADRAAERYEQKVSDDYLSAYTKILEAGFTDEEFEERLGALDRWREESLGRSGAPGDAGGVPDPGIDTEEGAAGAGVSLADVSDNALETAKMLGQMHAKEGPEAVAKWREENGVTAQPTPMEAMMYARGMQEVNEAKQPPQSPFDPSGLEIPGRPATQLQQAAGKYSLNTGS